MTIGGAFAGGVIGAAVNSVYAVETWYLSGGVSAANCIAAYQPKGAADLAGSYVNLNNPGTNNAVAVTAPDFNASTGWTFNGTDQYLSVGTVVGTNAQSVALLFSDGLANLRAICGVNKTAQVQNHIYPHYLSDHNCYWRCGGSYNTTGVNYASGVLASTPASGYYNGSPIGNMSGVLSGTCTYVYAIGAINENGSISGWPGKIQAFALYSVTLSDAQVLAISTAMAAL